MPDGARLAKRLGAIRAVTYTVPDLHVIEKHYPEYLGYRVVERGRIPQEVALAWGAPAVAGRDYTTLQPASGESVYLRFVQSDTAGQWRALTTHGWNATEIAVQDVDALAARFANSPFRILNGPKPLQRFPMIRAMQVLGPAGECLYLTQIGAGTGMKLVTAESFVGRAYIVVVGGPSLSLLHSTYAGFGNITSPPAHTRKIAVSWANGQPLDTEHAHRLVKLTAGTMLELDEYPPVTTPREVPEGELPPGMAIVSFEYQSIANCSQAGPVARALLPAGGSAATLRGAAGEIIELLEINQGS